MSQNGCWLSSGRCIALGLWLLLQHAHCNDDSEACAAVGDMIGRLNPGFWVPAYVFRSLSVRPGAIHPPNLTRSVGQVEFVGACDASHFRADSFVWQKPTSDGGDWVATTKAKPMQLNIDGVICPLTGLAVTTQEWPSLRLQFEECPRKTAVEVALVNGTGSSMRLARWMCKVAFDSQLCVQAALQLPADSNKGDWSSQEFLDLNLDMSDLAHATAQGTTRMQVYNGCYENLDWFVVNTPLVIDPKEYEMVLALKAVLAPKMEKHVKIPANIVVESVCIPDCMGQMPTHCHERAKIESKGKINERADFQRFLEVVNQEDVRPWAIFIFILCFLLGAFSSCLCAPSGSHPQKRARRIKQVALLYKDGTEASHVLR